MGKSTKSDATEAALSAVEEALKIDFGSVSDLEEEQPAGPSQQDKETASKPEESPAPATDPKPSARGERSRKKSRSAPPASGANPTALPQRTAKPADRRTERRAARAEKSAARSVKPQDTGSAQERSRSRKAANDDVRSIGNLLYGLQKRPSAAPFWTAFGLSVAWAFFGLLFAAPYWREAFSTLSSTGQSPNTPTLIGIGIAIVLPIILFWVMALLFWRSHEMRIVSRTMTEVAMRLAEPENIAKESVVTVGQAIRREVAAMTRR